MDAASPQSPSPHVPPAALGPAHPPTEPGDPEGFVPLCEDCRYDLSGLADGKCPECGLAFRRERLRALWVAREKFKRDRARDLPRVGLGLAAILSPFMLLLGPEVGTALLLAVWTAAAGVWLWADRDTWFLRSYLLLAYLPPLLLFTAVHAATPYGAYVVAAAAAVACVVSWTSLRHSPLVSAMLLLAGAVGPVTLLALAMIAHAAGRKAAGHHWTDFDYPTPTGWRALPVPQARGIAVWMLGLATAVAAVTLLYARRATVRLRARSKRPEAA